MYKVLIVVLLLVLAGPAFSEQGKAGSPSGEHRNISFNFAVGDGFFRGIERTQGKLISLSYSDSLPDLLRLPDPFIYKITGGLFNQNNFFNSSHTGFGSLSIGAEVIIPAGVYARIVGGPAVITQTDDRLGSIFQFMMEGALGFTYRKARVGMFYQHFSNGGITTANRGRDYYGVEVGLNF